MKILISFMVGMSISGTVRDRRSVPQMAEGPPGMIVAPSGAVYKPEECGMDGNGDGWCAGESVPAEYFIEKEKLKKNKKVKRSLIRIQTVKLKIPGKLFLKVGCRTSVTFNIGTNR